MAKQSTTQGDPLAMAMYAVGILPLTLQLKSEAQQIWYAKKKKKKKKKKKSEAQQIWYADDSSAGGKLDQLRRWWDKLSEIGPKFGYFVNAAKSILIVKEDYYQEAKQLFEGSKIRITTSGSKYLGTTIGNMTFRQAYIAEKVEQWRKELETLAMIATSQPQAAFTVLTQSLQHKWLFISRSTNNIGHLLQPIENVIRHKVIPAITGRQHINDTDRRLFSLPPKLGGLGIIIPTEMTHQEFDNLPYGY